jgi:hypothetical protein
MSKYFVHRHIPVGVLAWISLIWRMQQEVLPAVPHITSDTHAHWCICVRNTILSPDA